MKQIKRALVILLILIMVMPAWNVLADDEVQGDTTPNVTEEETNIYINDTQEDTDVYINGTQDNGTVGENPGTVALVGTDTLDGTENKTELKIFSVDDFMDFAANCVLDSYSKDLCVSLENDIDLSLKDFEGIPWFQGIFNGNGHTISGVEINRGGLNTGFFRTIGENGVVKNLKIEGNVTATGTAENVGGIAGENLGNIIECYFSGDIKGLKKIGGVAGINGESGVITSSGFEGSTQGEHQIGGIAGENLGTIALSSNYGTINIEAVVTTSSNSENIVNNIITGITDITPDDVLDVTDIGGIAGFSSGTIYKCENKGIIGYKHIGYNVGGVCGRSSGFVSLCTSANEVYGKNDVGGIVGQLEPSAAWDLSESNLTKLKDSFAVFEKNVNALNANISAAATEITGSAASLIAATTNTEKAFAEVIEAASGNAEEAAAALERTIENINEDNVREELKKLAKELQNLAPDTSELTSSVAETAAAAENFRNTISSDRGLYENTTAVIDSLANFVNTGINSAETLGLSEEYINDISVKEAYSENRGAIDQCSCKANVNGDTGIGGMVGTIDFEVSFDLENELGLSDYLFGNAKYQIFAVTRKCDYAGTINVKKSNAGGICGRQAFGLLMDSNAAGIIESDGADFVGGIAGYSDATIINCQSRFNLNGGSYIGGIAGQGKNISNCVAYCLIKKGTEILGGICGNAAGTLENNSYVNDGVGGIDGVDFDGKTKAITYKEMCDNKDVPDSFKKIEVTFVKEGEIYKTIPVEYGGYVEIIPEVPSENGKFWKWNDFENDNIKNSFIVEGDWQNAISTISTDEEIPLFLAEGSFNENQKLVITKLDEESRTDVQTETSDDAKNDGDMSDFVESSNVIDKEQNNKNYDTAKETLAVTEGEYRVEITGYEGPALIRIKGTNLEISEETDAGVSKLDVTEDGTYSLINMNVPGTIIISTKPKSLLWILFVAIGVAAVVVIIIIVVKRKKAKKKVAGEENEV